MGRLCFFFNVHLEYYNKENCAQLLMKPRAHSPSASSSVSIFFTFTKRLGSLNAFSEMVCLAICLSGGDKAASCSS